MSRRKWHLREPLLRFAKYLAAKGIMNEEQKIQIDAELDAEIKAAVAKAERKMAKTEELSDPLHMFDYSFAENASVLARATTRVGGPYCQTQKSIRKKRAKKKAPSPAQI